MSDIVTVVMDKTHRGYEKGEAYNVSRSVARELVIKEKAHLQHIEKPIYIHGVSK